MAINLLKTISISLFICLMANGCKADKEQIANSDWINRDTNQISHRLYNVDDNHNSFMFPSKIILKEKYLGGLTTFYLLNDNDKKIIDSLEIVNNGWIELRFDQDKFFYFEVEEGSDSRVYILAIHNNQIKLCLKMRSYHAVFSTELDAKGPDYLYEAKIGEVRGDSSGNYFLKINQSDFKRSKYNPKENTNDTREVRLNFDMNSATFYNKKEFLKGKYHIKIESLKKDSTVVFQNEQMFIVDLGKNRKYWKVQGKWYDDFENDTLSTWQ